MTSKRGSLYGSSDTASGGLAMNRKTSSIFWMCILLAFCIFNWQLQSRSTRERQERLDLAMAIRDDDLAKVKSLVPRHLSVNEQLGNGWTPLITAASVNSTKVARYLLSKGADVNLAHKELHNAPPLFWIGCKTRSNALELARLLIDRGADIKVRDAYGQTALHSATEIGCYDVADLLISKGAELNVKDKEGWTPLHHVTDINYAYKLIGKGAKLDNIFDAAWFADLDKVKDLIKADPKLINVKSTEKMTPIFYALQRNALDVVRFLISKGAKLDARDGDGSPPLFYAGSKEAVDILTAAGADVRARRNDGQTCVFASYDAKVIKALVAKGADINARDKSGNPALYYAALYNNTERAKALLTAGADPNAIKLAKARKSPFPDMKMLKLLRKSGYMK